MRKINRDYAKKRYANDPLFRFKKKMRRNIRKSLCNFKKNKTTEEILGCTLEEFKIYIEKQFAPWMTWENYGLYDGQEKTGWDIDHIIPLCSVRTEEKIYKLNHYSNLQPLCSYINRRIKKDKFILIEKIK